jgi:hypothetical protein
MSSFLIKDNVHVEEHINYRKESGSKSFSSCLFVLREGQVSRAVERN